MEPTTVVSTVKDPICGKDVIPGAARGWDYRFGGSIYHFCGSECRSQFQVDPDRALTGNRPVVCPTSEGPGDAQARWPAFRKLIAKIF